MRLRWITAILLLALPVSAQKRGTSWVADEMPLPLSVKTAEDLRLKAMAERQYLIFNLLGRGKLLYDNGNYAEAAKRWEELLRLPELDPKLASDLKPFAEHARKRAGGEASEAPVVDSLTSTPDAEPPRPALATVTGTVSGGEGGPGGAVVTLRRTDGKTPRARPVKNRSMLQKDKAFAPHVMVVAAGSTVQFKNMDPIFHNVFSLSATKKFDSGFHKAGGSEAVTFDKPGVVEVLCNIHASMQAYVVVVDTPYHAIAGSTGAFTIKNVPPGEYEVEVWHESASTTGKDKVTVGGDGAKVALSVGADKRKNPFPPDKYGKPRQTQLGY